METKLPRRFLLSIVLFLVLNGCNHNYSFNGHHQKSLDKNGKEGKCSVVRQLFHDGRKGFQSICNLLSLKHNDMQFCIKESVSKLPTEDIVQYLDEELISCAVKILDLSKKLRGQELILQSLSSSNKNASSAALSYLFDHSAAIQNIDKGNRREEIISHLKKIVFSGNLDDVISAALILIRNRRLSRTEAQRTLDYIEASKDRDSQLKNLAAEINNLLMFPLVLCEVKSPAKGTNQNDIFLDLLFLVKDKAKVCNYNLFARLKGVPDKNVARYIEVLHSISSGCTETLPVLIKRLINVKSQDAKTEVMSSILKFYGGCKDSAWHALSGKFTKPAEQEWVKQKINQQFLERIVSGGR